MSALRKIVNANALYHLIYFSLLVSIIIFTVFGDSGLYKLHSLNKMKAHMQYQIKENATRIEQLEKEKIRLTTPEYLESIIRKELGYIKNGEVVYQITD